MEGTVKWYNFKKGYGFIVGEDDQEYFVHYTAIPKGVFIRDNDKVSFDPAEGEKGKQAQNVQLVQKASDRTDLPAEGEEAPKESKEAPAEEPQPEAKEEAPKDSENF